LRDGQGCAGRRLLHSFRRYAHVLFCAWEADLPEALDNLRHNIAENCTQEGTSIVARALDISDTAQVADARGWSCDVVLGADLWYEPGLALQMVHAFHSFVVSATHRTGFMFSIRRSAETHQLFENVRLVSRSSLARRSGHPACLASIPSHR
jgi:hypothetical protein